MKSIAVFCGSSEGYNEVYREVAYQLGIALAEKNITLVFGGGKIGLMGAIADGVMQHGGKAIGVIPEFLQTKEVAHEGVTEMIVVDTMHQRKLKMHELSEGVITLPGGWGTMEEMFEMLTWGQLGLHKKPVALLNVNGYYDSLKVLANNMVIEGFLNEDTNKLLLTSESIDELLTLMDEFTAPNVESILKQSDT
ncbi:MAG: TIGR00730 family Rossman fold protein [Bacteroidetes bacterium]|nr:TIGR00730 family Rossman fold protein [Bacteroidota bacterium]